MHQARDAGAPDSGSEVHLLAKVFKGIRHGCRAAGLVDVKVCLRRPAIAMMHFG